MCSHPRAIDVEAVNGEVRLRGAILADEEDSVVRAVESVRGVEAAVALGAMLSLTGSVRGRRAVTPAIDDDAI